MSEKAVRAAGKLQERIAALEAELAKREEDAERYRYFKQCFDHPTERRELALRLGCKADEFDPDLDAAIDAAMEGEKR